MALLVGNHGSRDLSHHEHREVFNINDGVQSREGFRRPIVKRKPVTHNAIAALAAAICELSVDHEVPHSDDPLGHRIGEPIHYVNVMGSFLEQQPCRSASVSVPVLEVVVAAVSHEVPAPDCTDLADQTIVNNLAKDSNNGHVAHIVSNVQQGLCAECGLKHAIGAFNGDGDGLFQVDCNPGF